MKTRVQDELLTVQEFAEKAGVSVQAVYKRLNNSLNPYIQLVEGRKMLKSSALSEVYGVEVEQPIQPFIQPRLNGETGSSEVDFWWEQVAQLQAESSTERQHSRELAGRVAELSEKVVVLTDQAQKLQLAQMSPQLMDAGGGAADPAEPEPTPPPGQPQEPPEPEQPKSWWSRIFGK